MGKTELERPAPGNRVGVKSCGNNSTEQLVITACCGQSLRIKVKRQQHRVKHN